MQHKVIQTSNTKKNKEKDDSKKTINIINTILTNNSELSKHKSHEIYTQYSPSNLTNNNNNNIASNNNNSKKNTMLANTIKQIIHYSEAKKGNNSLNNGDSKDKEALMKENKKQKSSKEYTIININEINARQEENIIQKLKKNNLDNILSESDSCQEIDSMEEDSLSKGHRIKSSNMNLKNINNMKWDIIDNKNKINNNNFKKHLTTGFNNTNNNLKENKNSISSFTKKNTSKTAQEKKVKNMNINDNNEENEEEILINDNEFDNSRSIQRVKLIETKFPNLSTNPFTNDLSLKENNNDLYKKSNQANKNSIKNMNKNKENEKIIFTNHHIKSSTLGTIKQSSTNTNSSNLSNTIDLMNFNNIIPKKENNEKGNSNCNLRPYLNQGINVDNLYRSLLLMAKKGDKEKFLEILEKINSLPNKDLININYKDENGYSALHYASEEGNLKIVDILLKSNCDPNINNNEKKTPIHLSAKKGYFDVSKKLLENGALLNVYDSEKNSPLHYVCIFNHVELFKYFLGKFPKADSKNIYGKMPIDLTNNEEIKTILGNYLKQNENSYHKVKIYQTSDSKMKNLIERFPDEEEYEEEKYFSHSNKTNINMNPNIKKSNNNKNTSLSPGPNNKSPRKKLINRKKDYNSIHQSKNSTKKNTINIDLKKSNNLNLESNNTQNNNAINNKTNLNSVIKKKKKKNNFQKDNSISNSQRVKKDIIDNNSKKTNKVLIQDSSSNFNVNNTIKNNYNSILNKNVGGLKKTKTVEQFSSVNYNKTNTNKINLMNSSNKRKAGLNDSKISNTNYNNVNNSINNGINRINISFNTKKKEIKKLNKSINRFDSAKLDNKSKVVGNNPKYKNILLDSIESNNNFINLNKTEENINNISKTSLKKIKTTTKNKNLNNSKDMSNKNYNTIKIIENKEKTLSKSKYNNQNRNNKNKKKENPKSKEISDNNNINNCNISKISCGPQIINNNILDPINQTNIIDQTLADNIHAQLNLNSIEEERISPSSFICLAQLGKGSFGEVYLVQKINTQEKFAMKVLRKERIIGQNLLKYAIAERNVLSLSNHPFIVKLNFAFQTSSKLFLILEYCPNGDLAKHLLFEKRFPEERAKFYICEVLLALENLHKRDIIFRDLKPDNVVLDEEGHCKLTDFGLSKEGVNENQYAQSFCGSIAYLAPEMLKKQGHGKAVDWYLLGVLFYEMLVGITPFFTTRKEDIFHNIEYGELKIPEFISEGAASLLRGLLQKDPNKRLGGSIKDAQEIKEHPYFKDVDWDSVYNKKIPPPPVNIFTNKIMHVYHRPRLFANDDNMNRCPDKNNPNMLQGWSFINNEEF